MLLAPWVDLSAALCMPCEFVCDVLDTVHFLSHSCLHGARASIGVMDAALCPVPGLRQSLVVVNEQHILSGLAYTHIATSYAL